LARQMIENNRIVQVERKGFLDWLRVEISTDLASLSGKTAIQEYEDLSAEELITVLKRNQGKLPEGVRAESRAFQDRLRGEFETSRAKVLPLKSENLRLDRAIDVAVFELYGLSEAELAHPESFGP
jgi:hypothetical protein